jgi:hypothetical protein
MSSTEIARWKIISTGERDDENPSRVVRIAVPLLDYQSSLESGVQCSAGDDCWRARVPDMEPQIQHLTAQSRCQLSSKGFNWEIVGSWQDLNPLD